MERLRQSSAQREERFLDLLKSPDVEGTPDWAFWVPPFFNNALDIRRTQRIESGKSALRWTQGANFSFKTGDVIYDCPEGYGAWLQALRRMRRCLQVLAASGAVAAQPPRPRTLGFVHFDLGVPNADEDRLVSTGTHTLSQDDFVCFLISGEFSSKPK